MDKEIARSSFLNVLVSVFYNCKLNSLTMGF